MLSLSLTFFRITILVLYDVENDANYWLDVRSSYSWLQGLIRDKVVGELGAFEETPTN